MLAIVFAAFAIALYRGFGESEACALSFTALIIANLGLILPHRSWTCTILATRKTPNVVLWWVVGGASVFLMLVLSVPFLRELFQFAPLDAIDLLICLVAGILRIAWFELLKIFSRRNSRAQDWKMVQRKQVV